MTMSEAISHFTPSLSRPWLSRRVGECAFPVSGEGWETKSCCTPCGLDVYCTAHKQVMRGPNGPDFDALVAWLGDLVG